MGIVSLDLFPGLVLLVVQVVQIIEGHKVIKDVCAEKVGFGQDDATSQVHLLVRFVQIEDLPGEHHTGGLAPDLAAANAPATDGLQVSDSKKILGNTYEPQLVAYQAFGQYDDDLAQVVLDLGLLRRGKGFVGLAPGKEHVPGGQFRIEGQDYVVRRHPPDQNITDDLFKQGMGQIMSKVEIGQVVTKVGQASLPGISRFLVKGFP